jgi:hypothetical protein
MRGSPLIRALIAFVALLTLAPLLWQMTRPAVATQAPTMPVASSVEARPVKMELTFTTPPKRVSVLHLTREVWAKDMPEAEEEAELSFPWPKEGVDLHFKVDWPEGSRAAMRVKITDSERNEQEQTVWENDAVLTFK